MAFREAPRFPEDISYGSSGGPTFKTFVYEGFSGVEQRGITWSEARHRYDVSHGVRDKTDMDTVRAFFYNMYGRGYGFRFKDWSDYELLDEVIGTGDGATAIFNITKTYTSGAYTYVRRIYKPIATGFIVKVNGVTKTITTHYTLDSTLGIITFTGGNEPPAAQDVTVTGEFDVPVRFDVDQLSAQHDGYLTESWGSIQLVELREDDVV